MEALPDWVIFHVPHDSTVIPDSLKPQFILSEVDLADELIKMTDHLTLDLFTHGVPERNIVRAAVSRLVVDVERFASDDDERMASRGMGAVYTVTSQLNPLRRQLSVEERKALLQVYYFPHHAQLESAVEAAIERHGGCLVIDCHSFPDKPLPYELVAADSARPDICIGTDEFHTSDELASVFVNEFKRAGWRVQVNDPFAGALVPSSRYRRDRRVSAVMVEVNRRLYLREPSAQPLAEFPRVGAQIKRCCMAAIDACEYLVKSP